MNEVQNTWSIPHCGVSHFRKDKMTYTVVNNKTFVEAYTFSWITYKYGQTYVFFVNDPNLNSLIDEFRFYGLKTIENAISEAKNKLISI